MTNLEQLKRRMQKNVSYNDFPLFLKPKTVTIWRTRHQSFFIWDDRMKHLDGRTSFAQKLWKPQWMRVSSARQAVDDAVAYHGHPLWSTVDNEKRARSALSEYRGSRGESKKMNYVVSSHLPNAIPSFVFPFEENTHVSFENDSSVEDNILHMQEISTPSSTSAITSLKFIYSSDNFILQIVCRLFILNVYLFAWTKK